MAPECRTWRTSEARRASERARAREERVHVGRVQYPPDDAERVGLEVRAGSRRRLREVLPTRAVLLDGTQTAVVTRRKLGRELRRGLREGGNVETERGIEREDKVPQEGPKTSITRLVRLISWHNKRTSERANERTSERANERTSERAKCVARSASERARATREERAHVSSTPTGDVLARGRHLGKVNRRDRLCRKVARVSLP